MEGLEAQAAAEAQSLVARLYTQKEVVIRHSSRDSLMETVMQAFLSPSSPATEDRPPIVTRKLTFRSGLSLASLRLLQRVLNQPHCPIRELRFVRLKSPEEVAMVFICCRQEHACIHKLNLDIYALTGPRSAGPVVRALHDGLFGRDGNQPLPHLTTMELVDYPLGYKGSEILWDAVATNHTIQILRVVDCRILTDSMRDIASMIRRNTHLCELDLSYNKIAEVTSSAISEMVMKALINRGLKYNMTLRTLSLRPSLPIRRPLKRNNVDRQLAVNRFLQDFVNDQRDPSAIAPSLWPHVLARVAAKPSALHKFLCEMAVPIFGT